MNAFIAVLVVVLLALAGWLWSTRKAEEAAARWIAADGSVVSSSVQSRVAANEPRPNIRYVVAVSYEYEVNGRRYRSDRARFSGTRDHLTPEAAETERRRYAEGSTVRVLYDPSDPSSAVLAPER